MNKISICFVATFSWSLRGYIGNLILEASKTYHVNLVASSFGKEELCYFPFSIKKNVLKIHRKPLIIQDLFSLFQLFLFFKRNDFTIVHSILPKSGLLTAIAAYFSGIPIRIHTFTGQFWLLKKGPSKLILQFIDKIIARLSTHITTDSFSQMEFLIQNNIVSRDKIRVLHNGSIGGIDINKFNFSIERASSIRKSLQIDVDAITFIYVGRLAHDKGLLTLYSSFERLLNDGYDIHLILVGSDEGAGRSEAINTSPTALKRIHFIDFTEDVCGYLSASNVLCIPSLREGFGNVVLEAAALSIPSIGSDIYGLTDSILDCETGLLFIPGNEADLYNKMLILITDKNMRAKLGRAAFDRAKKSFSHQDVTNAYINFYESLESELPSKLNIYE